MDYSLLPVAGPGEDAGSTPSELAPETATHRRAVLGSDTLPAMVERSVHGMTAGSTVDQTAESDGSTYQVTVTVHEVERLVLPALDDEFAKDLAFADLAALRADVQGQLDREAARRSRENQVRAALAHLLATNPFAVPTAAVERLADSSLMDMLGGMKSNPDMAKRMLRALRPTMLPVATATLKRSLAIEALADQLAVTIGDDAVAFHIEKTVAAAPAGQRAQVRRQLEESGRVGVKVRLREEAAVDALIAAAAWTITGSLSLQAAREAEQHARDGDHDGDGPAAATSTATLTGTAAHHVHGPDCDHDHGPDHSHDAEPTAHDHGATPVPAP